MKINNILKFIIAITVSELTGIIGSIFTIPSVSTWYKTLVQPALNPPSWVFGPVWTTLFAMMGVALFLVWKKGFSEKSAKYALGIFAFQLFLNLVWSILFFGLHIPAVAFAEIVLLWLAILATIVAFAKISKPAAWLLVPYIIWVSFAGYLNFMIWQLNAPTATVVADCAGEIKLCPDGSSVGRIGPKCEFAPCLDYVGIKPWQTITDSKSGATFSAPEQLSTKYISTVEWPPQIQILKEPFACTDAGTEITRRGQTEKRTIDGRTYCVTKMAEGAAGSIYTQYAYAFSLAGKTIIFTFTLRAVQCANYDDPQKTACENERLVFDPDRIVDRMANSLKM